MQGLFITGTDTGVGKTYVTAALARLLRHRGWPVRCSKPVATGATWNEGRWRSEDAQLLADAAGDDPDQVTPWTFPEPAAPPVAARAAGVELNLRHLLDAVLRRTAPGTIVLAEGVGGLLCPLTEQETVADLIAALGWPTLVVTRRSLGTLNHTLLTVESAQRRGLTVAGVIVNETSPCRGLAEETAPEEIRHRIAVPLLAVLRFQEGFDVLDSVLDQVIK